MGLMCSVARSAQADMHRVDSRRMTRARQRDQWTTALWWWPGTGEESRDVWDTPEQSQEPALQPEHLGTLTVTVADVDVVDVCVGFEGEEEPNKVGSREQDGHRVHQGSVGHR